MSCMCFVFTEFKLWFVVGDVHVVCHHCKLNGLNSQIHLQMANENGNGFKYKQIAKHLGKVANNFNVSPFFSTFKFQFSCNSFGFLVHLLTIQ